MARRAWYALGTLALGVGALVALAPAAGADTLGIDCDPHTINGDGSIGGSLGVPVSTTNDFHDWTAPAEVEAASAFDLADAGGTSTIPATSEAPILGTVHIDEMANIVVEYQVDGAASVDSATLSGGNVIGATAAISGDNVRVTMPGATAGSDIPGATAHFAGGSTFTPPVLTIGVTAGAVGSTVTSSIVGFEASQQIQELPALFTRIICAVDTNTLTTTQVVAPPGADAPNAIADVAEVGEGGSVTINVLANDEPNDDWATDPSTLAIVTPPAHGTATIDPGGLGTAAVGDITYTPDPGFSGTDSFQYRVCSEALSDDDVRCDTATVTITVNAAAAPPTTAPSPETTPAPGGGELPRTGGGRSTVPLGAVGLGALVAGLTVLAMRTRRPRFQR